MVQFGKKLLTSGKPEWLDHYIDYDTLKRCLNEYVEERDRLLARSRSFDRAYFHEKNESKFSETLDREIEKVVLFFLKIQGDIAEDLGNYRRTIINLDVMDIDHVEECCAKYREIAHSIIEVLEFVDMNIQGVRKILKKHDKMVGGRMLAARYLKSRQANPYSSLKQLHSQEGLGALIGFVRYSFEQLWAIKIAIRGDGSGSLGSGGSGSGGGNDRKFASMEDLAAIRARLEGKPERVAPSLFRIKLNDRSSTMKRSLSDLEPILHQITKAKERLSESKARTAQDYLSSTSDLWLEGSLWNDYGKSGRDTDYEDEDGGSTSAGGETTDEEAGRGRTQPKRRARKAKKRIHGGGGGVSTDLDQVSFYLNLASTFLYMVNYYIVGPTSGIYAQHLHAPPSFSGIIIGMAAAAAGFSNIGYSYWTNFNYKYPLIFCTLLLVVGNLLYALAYDANALWMVLFGRLLVGLGGARGINRRYIADTTPRKLRTSASAAFVTSGALGMAAGPATSTLLQYVDFGVMVPPFIATHILRLPTDNENEGDHSPPGWAFVNVNNITSPGYFMFVIWVVYGLLLVFFFKEPSHELRRVNMGDASSTNTTKDKDKDSHRHSHKHKHKLKHTHDKGGRDSVSTGGGELVPASYSSSTSSSSSAPAPSSSTHLMAAAQKDKDGRGGYSSISSSINGSAADIEGNSNKDKDKDNSRGRDRDRDREEYRGGESSPNAPLLCCCLPRGKSKSKGGDGSDSGGESACSCVQYISADIWLMLWLYFVNKIVVEGVICSSPVICTEIFGMSTSAVGIMLAVFGLLVLPSNLVVGRISSFTEDRTLILYTGFGGILTLLLLVPLPDAYSPFTYTVFVYIAGALLVFLNFQVMEGAIMSLLSKLVPVELAKGLCNSGLLASESGTLGRAVGDVFITVFGAFATSKVLLDYLFLPCIVLTLICCGLVYLRYDKIRV